MQAIALLYHDVVEGDDLDRSGFPGGAAALYKLDARAFRRHMATVAAVAPRPPGLADDVYIHQFTQDPSADNVCIHRHPSGSALDDVCIHRPDKRLPVVLTFDDGGISAHAHIADILDELGFLGHFFVTTDFIGRPGFVGVREIRELARRGHVIGSHSCSHPLRMAACSAATLRAEWRVSTARLADILGEAVTTASVPGGYYAPRVAEAAAAAGIRTLFTSEPRVRAHEVCGVKIIGRFCIKRGAASVDTGAIARGALVPRLWATLAWNAKKVAKRIGGDAFIELRERLYGGAWRYNESIPALGEIAEAPSEMVSERNRVRAPAPPPPALSSASPVSAEPSPATPPV